MNFENVPPSSLAELIELDVVPKRVWHPHELAAVLAHELSVPLVAELGVGISAAFGNHVGETRGAGDNGTAQSALSLGDLLRHARPPLELLERLKAFAKAARRDPESHLPEDVAAVLYALAVAAALVRHGQKITSMPAEALGRYLAWATDRPWLHADLQPLLREAVSKLPPVGPGPAA